MEKVIIETIKSVVKETQSQNGTEWVNLAPLGLALNARGINFKNLGFFKLKEMFEDPELQPFFDMKKDDTHTPPIYYVQLRNKPIRSTKIPSRQHNNDYNLIQWAYFRDFPSSIARLKEMALKEKWYYKRQNPSNPYPILSNYIKYTFVRLMNENKVVCVDDYAAFNTGLVNALFDPIFALFKKNQNEGKQPWFFIDFCVAGQDREGKNLSRIFNHLPEKAKYFQSADDYIYDGQTDPSVDWEHIILENVDRLPWEFIEENKPKDFIPEDVRLMDADHRREYYLRLANAIRLDSTKYRRIKMRIEDALRTAIKRANWNYKTAIPMYYPSRNTTSLLLPLSLLDESTIDLALVIEKQPSGNYIGQTIIPLEWAYSNARLITRPDSDWLVTDNIVDEEPEID